MSVSIVSFNSTKRKAQSSIISYTLALDLPLRKKIILHIKLRSLLFSSASSLVRGFHYDQAVMLTRTFHQGPGQGQGLEEMWSHQCEHSRHLN